MEFSLSMGKLLLTVSVTEQVTQRACGDFILGNRTQVGTAWGTLLCLSLLPCCPCDLQSHFQPQLSLDSVIKIQFFGSTLWFGAEGPKAFLWGFRTDLPDAILGSITLWDGETRGRVVVGKSGKRKRMF